MPARRRRGLGDAAETGDGGAADTRTFRGDGVAAAPRARGDSAGTGRGDRDADKSAEAAATPLWFSRPRDPHAQVTIARGQGGCIDKLEIVFVSKKRHFTHTLSTFEIKGGRVYLHDDITYQYEQEAKRKFKRTSIRVVPEAPTAEDDELYRTYSRLRSAESGDGGSGDGEPEIVELSLADDGGGDEPARTESRGTSSTPFAQKKDAKEAKEAKAGNGPPKKKKARRDSRLDYGNAGEGHNALKDTPKKKARRNSRVG